MLMKIIAAAAVVLGFGATAHAQQPYPNKPITMIVGNAAGGLTDVAGRLYADVVSKSMGQRIVIENKPGGYVAHLALLQAPADGYTIYLAAGGPHEILSNLQPPPFDPIKDFRFITMLFDTTTFIWTRGDLPVANLKEMAELAKKTKGGLTWGSIAAGSPGHLTGELFKQQSAAPFEIVQYSTQGGAGIFADIVSGRLDITTGGYNLYQAGLENKTIKMIAVNSNERSPRFPNVPTMAENGFPDGVVAVWWGLTAPAKTPEAIVKRLHEEFTAASRDPGLRQKMVAQDINPRISTPEEITEMVTRNRERYGKVIRDAGIKLN